MVSTLIVNKSYLLHLLSAHFSHYELPDYVRFFCSPLFSGSRRNWAPVLAMQALISGDRCPEPVLLHHLPSCGLGSNTTRGVYKDTHCFVT